MPRAPGTVDKETDLILAVNTGQWGNGHHCFETTPLVQFGGKAVQAKITDENDGPDSSCRGISVSKQLGRIYLVVAGGYYIKVVPR
ncbi:hypothetical protein C8Q79DRAFT_768111 [Trametes meyenii]|nr:hypothetical protein C8Q79DRAFT_768111 [Trametes meyenii]